MVLIYNNHRLNTVQVRLCCGVINGLVALPFMLDGNGHLGILSYDEQNSAPLRRSREAR